MKKRIAFLLLTSICLMNTVPGFAAQSTKVSIVGSQGTQYTTLPDAETLQKDVGFSPKTPAALTGGYQFEEGRITELSDLDDKGDAINKHTGISFRYKKSDNTPVKSVSLSAEATSDQSFSTDSVVIKYEEINLYYSDSQANSVSWIDSGIFYILMNTDKTVSKDELVAMAKEIIG